MLLCPVSAEPPFPDLLDVTSKESFSRVAEAQLPMLGLPFMGLPGLTVTTDATGSSPIGVQLVAGRYREDILLAAAAILEESGTIPVTAEPSSAS